MGKGSDFQTKRNSLLNVLDGLRLCLALADTSGNRRAFHHPNPIFIAVNGR
jgi:hypothetical protein